MPPAERIATFDQEGTLWVEHPMYTQVLYCFDRHGRGKEKPEFKEQEPFKTVLSGNHEAIAKLSKEDLEKILMATLSGMSVEEFQLKRKVARNAKDPRWKRPYTELTYQPMQEVLRYLRANGFKTYIVTGGARTLCAHTRKPHTVFRRNKSSAPPAAPSTVTTRRASRS